MSLSTTFDETSKIAYGKKNPRQSIWISILMVTWGIVSVEAYLVHRRSVSDSRVLRS
jgi:hypothetical protein